MQSCDISYKVEFSDSAEIKCDEIWIAGGVYGNIFAIEKLNELAGDSTIVYNGDLHWFDANPAYFNQVEELTKNSIKLNGNVELELARESDKFGCGCNYPEWEEEIVVKNAELIHQRLKSMDADFSIFKDRGTALFAEVLGLKVAITHGDEKMLNGWGFDHEVLAKDERIDEIKEWFFKTKFDIIATTHTCKAAVMKLGNNAFINNGSTGMPNFSEFITGLVTRIGKEPHKNALYSTKIKDAYVELVMLRYDRKKFLNYLDEIWEEGSPAQISYRERILGYGCPLSYKDINLGGFIEVE
ncbi:MAG: calcineurin phosphoesterase [Campylobacteraceae bacterium]|nr:calcineurin phosphoesterase [Campylobacteraceae bacterium]